MAGINPFDQAWTFLKTDDVPTYDPFEQETYDVGAASCANCKKGNLDEQTECTNCGDKWCPECYDALSNQWMHHQGDICPKCNKKHMGER